MEKEYQGSQFTSCPAHITTMLMVFQLLEGGLQVQHYPVEQSDLDDSIKLSCPPVGASVTLPDFVVFLQTPHVARWDAAGTLDINSF